MDDSFEYLSLSRELALLSIDRVDDCNVSEVEISELNNQTADQDTTGQIDSSFETVVENSKPEPRTSTPVSFKENARNHNEQLDSSVEDFGPEDVFSFDENEKRENTISHHKIIHSSIGAHGFDIDYFEEDSSSSDDDSSSSDMSNSSKCSACLEREPHEHTFDVSEHTHFRVNTRVSEKDIMPVNVMSVKYSKRLQQKITSSELKKVLSGKKRCCCENCLKVHGVDKRYLKQCRKQYWAKEKNARKQWLINKIRQGSKYHGILYICDDTGRRFCQHSFMSIFGISKSVYYRHAAHVRNGECIVTTSNNKRLSPTCRRAIIWLNEFAKHHGDVMPDMKKTRLPPGMTKKYVYEEYKKEQIEEFKPYLGKSRFYDTWCEFFTAVTKMRKSDNFSRCTICTSISRQLAKEEDLTKRAALVHRRKEHNDRQMQERLMYYAKRDLARKHPRKYLSLIVDGMDQNKTNLPHMLGRTAKVMGNDRLKTHVTGIIAHGPTDQQFTFLDKGEFPHDSNMTINIIMKVIWHLSSKGKKPLPPTLFLQADNCWRENKNKFVLAFLEVLVHIGVFKEIQLSFLIVGHTHDDIDQLFSQIAELLNQHEAEILPELMRLLPNVEELYGLYDFRQWMNQHLSNIKGHTQPHHFRFVHDPNSSGPTNVNVQFRGSATDPWVNLGSSLWKASGSRCFNARCTPSVVQPDLNALNMDYLKSKFDRWSCVFSDQKDHSQLNWWKQYAEIIIRTKSSLRSTTQYAKRNALWALPKLPKCDISGLPDGDQLIGDALHQLLAAETRQPQVSIR